MAEAAQIGVTGLAVMGRNLARNLARHGHTVALHNRSSAKTKALVDEFGHEGTFVPAEKPEPTPYDSPSFCRTRSPSRDDKLPPPRMKLPMTSAG